MRSPILLAMICSYRQVPVQVPVAIQYTTKRRQSKWNKVLRHRQRPKQWWYFVFKMHLGNIFCDINGQKT